VPKCDPVLLVELGIDLQSSGKQSSYVRRNPKLGVDLLGLSSQWIVTAKRFLEMIDGNEHRRQAGDDEISVVH